MRTLVSDDDGSTGTMAEPMSADRFVSILRAEGLTVIEHRSWRINNRNHKGPWGPVHGVMLHHTAGHEQGAVSYCYYGSAALPGPLCHGVITKDGVVHLVGHGRTNHAGGGDPDTLRAVINEDYATTPPRPDVGNATGVDGNRHFYGFEPVNLGDGVDPWPAAQVEAMVRVSAAIARDYQWTEKSVIGHKEWSRDKSDPRGPGDVVSMPRLRAKIGERLAHPASWNPGAGTTPPQGPDMPKPDRQMLYRTEDTQLIPNSPYRIYWTSEGQDDGQGHGAGGKTMATNVCYSTVLTLSLTGLGPDEHVEVYPVEENQLGQMTGQGKSAYVDGRAGGAAVTRAVPVIGIVGERYLLEVVNRGAQVVTMTDAQAASQYWPNV